jgi:hypothetical protein
MGRPRGTSAKRNREQKLKERALAKAARRSARKLEVRLEKGPPTDSAPPMLDAIPDSIVGDGE